MNKLSTRNIRKVIDEKMFGSKLFTRKFELPPDISFMGPALIVGIGTGLGAVAFRYLINYVEFIGYDWFPQITSQWGNAYVIIIPMIGGLIVGPLIYFFFAREAKGHGVPEVMEAVALRGGRIRPVVAIVKSLASSISIGSGGSVGAEGKAGCEAGVFREGGDQFHLPPSSFLPP